MNVVGLLKWDIWFEVVVVKYVIDMVKLDFWGYINFKDGSGFL